MSKFNELETVLLDQIEKLSDDSICEDPNEANALVNRSNAMVGLTNSFINIYRTKIDAVKILSQQGAIPAYEKFLGIEAKSPKESL